jgi:hypothetical protein
MIVWHAILGLEVASNRENMALWQALVVQLWTNFKNWITHHKTSYWALFVIDDGSKVNPFAAQMMCCIVCYYDDNIPTKNNTWGYAKMISCDKDHGTNSIKKHVSSLTPSRICQVECQTPTKESWKRWALGIQEEASNPFIYHLIFLVLLDLIVNKI